MGSRQVQDDRTIDAEELLDVRELVDYMDHLVICTGRSARQNRAIAEHVITQLKREHRVLPLSRAGLDAGSWVCIDFVDVVLHVFEPDGYNGNRGPATGQIFGMDGGHVATLAQEILLRPNSRA